MSQYCNILSTPLLVTFPDPTFSMKEMGLAHFARNLGLADSAGEEQSCDHRYIYDSGCGLELKRRLGQGKPHSKFAMLRVRCVLCCSQALEDT